MSEVISWPIGPLEGDQYSVNGKFWEWNGCAWISTCCPGICDIYETGIIFGITEPRTWGPGDGRKRPVTTKICFKYDSQTGTWNSETINSNGDYYQMAPTPEGNVWDLNLMSLGMVKSAIGGIAGTTPIGRWEWKGKNQIAESICGCPPMICGCLLKDPEADCEYISFFPISLTGVSGETVGYIDISSKFFIYYNTIASRWELYPENWATPLYTISLPITTVPIGPDIGDWTATLVGQELTYSFSTTVGHCEPCNPYTDGIILAYTDEDGLITYVPLTWNATTDQFENFDGSIYIEYNGAGPEWNLWINGSLAYSHKGKKGVPPDLLGFWDKPFTILCGSTSITNTEGCLVAISGGSAAATLYLQESTSGEFNYGYPFSIPTWQIVCNGGVWTIQKWNDSTHTWVTQAYVTAPCTTPPYGLTWTVSPGADYDSFTFTAGPCPIVCNSYQFRSLSGDSTTVSFKLCGCSQRVYINAPAGGISPAYCVQEDSIELGAYGGKQLISADCTPNPTQCYTISIRNSNQNGASSFTYTNCNGDTVNATLQSGGETQICARQCSINVTSGSIYTVILSLGCN